MNGSEEDSGLASCHSESSYATLMASTEATNFGVDLGSQSLHCRYVQLIRLDIPSTTVASLYTVSCGCRVPLQESACMNTQN